MQSNNSSLSNANYCYRFLLTAGQDLSILLSARGEQIDDWSLRVYTEYWNMIDHRNYIHSLKDHFHDKAHVQSWLTPIFLTEILLRAQRIHRGSAWCITYFSKISLSNCFWPLSCLCCAKKVSVESKYLHFIFFQLAMHIYNYLNSRPKDRNISTQHIDTLLGQAYYVLRAFGHPAATCFDNEV